MLLLHSFVFREIICILTAMMLTKSFSPSVSRMVLMVCLAIVSLRPFMLPLTSTTMITSLGEVAACIYLKREKFTFRKQQRLFHQAQTQCALFSLKSRDRQSVKLYPFICSSVLLFLLPVISLLSSPGFLSSLA